MLAAIGVARLHAGRVNEAAEALELARAGTADARLRFEYTLPLCDALVRLGEAERAAALCERASGRTRGLVRMPWPRVPSMPRQFRLLVCMRARICGNT